jgi:hypothetical protein
VSTTETVEVVLSEAVLRERSPEPTVEVVLSGATEAVLSEAVDGAGDLALSLTKPEALLSPPSVR